MESGGIGFDVSLYIEPDASLNVLERFAIFVKFVSNHGDLYACAHHYQTIYPRLAFYFLEKSISILKMKLVR